MLHLLPIFGLLLCASQGAWAVEVIFKPVAPGVFAYVGDMGGRSYDNEGLNANVGLVVTHEGAVLIDSGASYQSAQKIEAAAKKITALPIKWVINTGGQDHRWLGNGYFVSRAAEAIAHANAKADMLARGGDHLAALTTTLKDRVAGTVPTLPTRFVDGPDVRLTLGGVTFELRHRGGGHTPGDMLVWLPSSRVMFSGDIVYVNRMLGVIPVSNTQAWLATFNVMEALKPQTIVPGHGSVTDLATAKADTADYLVAMRTHMKKAVDDGIDVSAASQSFDAKPFMRLLNAADLVPGNASRTYLEVERE